MARHRSIVMVVVARHFANVYLLLGFCALDYGALDRKQSRARHEWKAKTSDQKGREAGEQSSRTDRNTPRCPPFPGIKGHRVSTET